MMVGMNIELAKFKAELEAGIKDGDSNESLSYLIAGREATSNDLLNVIRTYVPIYPKGKVFKSEYVLIDLDDEQSFDKTLELLPSTDSNDRLELQIDVESADLTDEIQHKLAELGATITELP